MNNVKAVKNNAENFVALSSRSSISSLDIENRPFSKKKAIPLFLVKLLFVRLGIYVLVIIYIFAGAYLFQMLENQNMLQNCQYGSGKTTELIEAYRNDIFNYVYFNTTSNYLGEPGLDSPDVAKKFLYNKLQNLRTEFLLIFNTYSYSGQDCDAMNLWSIESAFLFTMTIVTSLGYGHVTPKTWEGQIVCICYATIGIPLFLIALASISNILSKVFLAIYAIIICKEKMQEKKMLELERQFNKNIEINEDEDDEDDDDGDYEELTIPLVIILSTFASFLYLGSLIFSQIESWTNIQAAYYSYVSLSTIGFGDFVPGISALLRNQTAKASSNLLIASAYIFFGIAIMGMCFTLIIDEVKRKLRLLNRLIRKYKTIKRRSRQKGIKDIDNLGDSKYSQVDEEYNLEQLESKHKILFVKQATKSNDLKIKSDLDANVSNI